MVLYIYTNKYQIKTYAKICKKKRHIGIATGDINMQNSDTGVRETRPMVTRINIEYDGNIVGVGSGLTLKQRYIHAHTHTHTYIHTHIYIYMNVYDLKFDCIVLLIYQEALFLKLY